MGFTEDFAEINFRKLSLTNDFGIINFREGAIFKISRSKLNVCLKEFISTTLV